MRLRLGVSFLKPHRLRFSKTTQEKFDCAFCENTYESEIHFLLVCPKYSVLNSTPACQHDRKCRLKSSQYTLIIPHRVIQLTTISFWVSETKLRLPQVNKSTNKQIPFEACEEPSDTVIHFIFVFSSFTGEFCSQSIRGNDRRLGRMFPEHVERRFLDPEYSFGEYFQLGSRRKVGPIKNQLASPNTSN